ncbi:Hypothetical predicted protein [Octopus vulgaris]|uniref:Uncharacterized protein n=1 Tax=Octopus vulgaris TaxID=6645 RepID=A0AA36B9C1_OCTVU|nr:Hypothetical predicted protein [Octopus vulgaris]
MTWKRKSGIGRTTRKAAAIKSKRQSNSEYRQAQQNMDTEAHRIRRDTEVRESEQSRNTLARKRTRKNPQVRASEQIRNTLARRKLRQVQVQVENNALVSISLAEYDDERITDYNLIATWENVIESNIPLSYRSHILIQNIGQQNHFPSVANDNTFHNKYSSV